MALTSKSCCENIIHTVLVSSTKRTLGKRSFLSSFFLKDRWDLWARIRTPCYPSAPRKVCEPVGHAGLSTPKRPEFDNVLRASLGRSC